MALVNTGLIARYFFDEAASGNTPTEAVDSSGVGTAFNLPLNYSGTTMAYTELATGRGLDSNDVQGTQGARGAVDNTSDKVRDALDGATQATVECVMHVDGFGLNVSRVFGLFVSGGSHDLGITGGAGEGDGSGGMRLMLNNTVVLRPTTNPDSARRVVHMVVDTTIATPSSDRVKLYWDGVRITGFAVSNPPAQNTQINLSTNTLLTAVGMGSGSRNLNGAVYYGALYSHALTAQEVSDNYDILTLDDDTPAAGTPDPVLTDVDTDEILVAGQTNATCTGTDLGATTADRSFWLVQGDVSVEQAQVSGNATGGVFDVTTEPAVGAHIKHGDADFEIIRDDLESDFEPVTVEEVSGHLWVDIVTPNPTAGNRITAVGDMVSTDQLEVRGEGGGAVPTGLSINDDGTFQFANGTTAAPFDARLYDNTNATEALRRWGAWATQNIAVELAVAAAAHGQSAGSPLLSQGVSLVPADAAHGQAADAVGLTEHSTLAPAAAAHAQTADSPLLTEASLLTAAPATHAQSADGVALSQGLSLVPADAAHAQTAASPLLSQAHLLVVTGVHQAQTAATVVLSAEWALAPDAATHGQTAGEPLVSQGHQLTVSSAAHGQAADSVVLGLADLLAVADALHATSVDNVLLSQAHLLTVISALQAQRADNVLLGEAQSLTVEGTSHVQSAEGVLLSAGAVLAAADALHVCTTDSVLLSQAHLLLVSDALHAQLAQIANLALPGASASTGAVFVIEAGPRVYVVPGRSNSKFLIAPVTAGDRIHQEFGE